MSEDLKEIPEKYSLPIDTYEKYKEFIGKNYISNQATYNETGNFFVQQRVEHPTFFKRVVEPTFKAATNGALKDGGVLGDVHGGSGYLAHLLISDVDINPEEIHIIDQSEVMLELAESMYKKYDSDQKAYFVNDDAVYMEQIEDDKFDVLVSAYGVDYTEQADVDNFFNNSFRVVKPGGRFIMLIPSFGRDQEYLNRGLNTLDLPSQQLMEGEYLETTFGLKGNLVQKTYLRPESWLDAALKAGFDIRALTYPVSNRSIDAIDPSTPINSDESPFRVVAFSFEKNVISAQDQIKLIVYDMLLNDLEKAETDSRRNRIFEQANTNIATIKGSNRLKRTAT